jgi:integrase/recombinase XerD
MNGPKPKPRFLRSVSQSGMINGSLSPAAIRGIVRRYGACIGVPDLNPHDLRRTCAKLARLGGAPLETIQKTLGHSSLTTTERYLQTGEEANAGDYIELKL